jgi:Rrf2 family protein
LISVFRWIIKDKIKDSLQSCYPKKAIRIYNTVYKGIFPSYFTISYRRHSLQITRQADYAIRTILYLAKVSPKQPVATRQIAKEQNIPPSFLAKIVSQLSLVGLLHTSRGATGGVLLSRPHHMISLLEVIEAIDGPITINECAGDRGKCSMCVSCEIRPIFCEIREELVSKLRSYTFDKILGNNPVPIDEELGSKEMFALPQV